MGRGTVYERLAALRQTGTVEEYVQQFELLVAQAPTTSEDQMLGYFLVGLRQDIRGQVRPRDPQDVTPAMEVVRDIEEAMKGFRNYGGSQNRNSGMRFRYQGGGGIVSRVGAFSGTHGSQSVNRAGRISQEGSKATSMASVAKPTE